MTRTTAWAAVVCFAALAFSPAASARAGDWPMLGYDAARTGSTADEIRPPLQRKWYRLFAQEGIQSGLQPIVGGGRGYLGTLAGTLHAMDAQSGKDVWTFRAGGAILHSAAAGEGRIFFGCTDGKIYALNSLDGAPAWTVQTGAAVWNAPILCDGLVVIGGRDGKLYAVEAGTGKVRWTAPVGGPLLSSPAADARRTPPTVYAAAEDMRVYAFALADGRRLWQSPKLGGVSFRGYHPVIAPDGSVMVTSMTAASHDLFQQLLMDMVKEVFGDMASWRHKKDENDRLRQANFKRLAEPGCYEAQLAYLRKRLSDQPALQTFFVLDPADGRPRMVPPIVASESMNGTAAPPIVTAAGQVVVKYQALLRSRYEHYSPFLNVGYLDTRTGHITPIMDQDRTYGWHDSLLLVHDEMCQLSAAGRVLLNTHQDNVNAMDLQTRKGFPGALASNIHEPKPGEALAIWAALVRGQELPAGKEWLARGTAVYGGGSAIDVPVVIAGDSLYFLPTHEINAGVALIAYRMAGTEDTAGREGLTSKAIESGTTLSQAERGKLLDMDWDWDTLAAPRIDSVLKALGASPPGTKANPLTQRAREAVAKITDAELDRYVWAESNFVPHPSAAPSGAGLGGAAQPADQTAEIRARLKDAVSELLSAHWRPLIFPAGKHPIEGYRFFAVPSDTLLALARAYPHLDRDLQERARTYVRELAQPGGMLAGPTGQKIWTGPAGPTDPKSVRSAYDEPPAAIIRVRDDILSGELARLYAVWLWARNTDDWDAPRRHWAELRKLADQPPNAMEEDCRNGRIAGLIAYCRLARKLDDPDALAAGLAAARKAMRERLEFELAHPRGGVMSIVPVQRTILSRWRNLSPELGHLLADHAPASTTATLALYIDRHRPAWMLAWNTELLWRNESPFSLPTMAWEVFTAKAYLARTPRSQLARYVDIPWCKADLYYIQKLACCLSSPS